MKIHFTKMHGAGNDYIYVYTPDNPIASPEQTSIEWSKFHFGIGSDGLILIGKSDKADFTMRIFNNDGSEAMMCGNGIRCVGKFVYDHHLTDKEEIIVDTLSGIKILKLHVKDGKVNSATVDMGEPLLENKKQLATETGGMIAGEIEAEGQKFIGTYVCMGNPHFVIFVPDVMQIPLTEIGPKLEHHSLFPERCNIEFAQVREDGSIRMRVWERGSGITMACGTGACATAVAAALNKKAGRSSDIEMDGGMLHIDWSDDNHIFMTGPATTVFEGEIEL
ncbi:diaminopimelate epimerase [uncultured Bacteroides sp.]|uniref:diaminopimelate epimerase n=1 Tax=uncultured Bacteroides sp. TaxID=162156 RepID=UPI002623C04E|nr:diaminopimelate epimerase [uncultured Bacteroides sp.]